MHLFALVAAMMAVGLLIAGAQRPRLAVLVAAILWLLYAVYEYLVAARVLCEADCNIRVDLVFFLPILAVATYWAYQAYIGRPGQMKIIGTVLGVIGVFAFGLVAEGYGYGGLASLVVLGAVVAGVVYAIRSRSNSNRP
jgi:hypothetical protein